MEKLVSHLKSTEITTTIAGFSRTTLLYGGGKNIAKNRSMLGGALDIYKNALTSLCIIGVKADRLRKM